MFFTNQICKICGKKYEYCSDRLNYSIHWKVVCSIKCWDDYNAKLKEIQRLKTEAISKVVSGDKTK